MKIDSKVIKGIAIGIVVSTLYINIYSLGLEVMGMRKINSSQKIEKINELLEKKYIEDIDYSNLEDMMLHGYVYGLEDPYTTYMSKVEFDAFMENSSGTYYGIGASIVADEIDNTIKVVLPFAGSPSYEAGIRPGDKIIKVNGVEVYGSKLNEGLALIKGRKGTKVTLTILKEDSKEYVDIEITRDEISLPTISDKKIDDKIGYIRITGFDRVTLKQFNEAYDRLLLEGVEGLIIDVRNNPGGLLDVVGDITDRLIPEGIITYTEEKSGKRDDILSDAEEIEIPLVILMNRYSASASEVLSGAVQDTGKGILIGEQSFGKGLVQNIFPLGDGSALKVTVAKYYTPNGVCIQDVGLTPDIKVEMTDEQYFNIDTLTLDEDAQLKTAVEYINKNK